MKNLLFIIFLSFINIEGNQKNEILKNQLNLESMGYSVYITRLEEKKPISHREWLNYAKHDPEIEVINGDVEFTNPQTGKKIIRRIENDTNYLHKSGPVTFRYWDKRITVKNPTDDIIRKMLSIAKKLDAIVMGDGGVIFDDSYFEKKTREEKSNQNNDKESSKKKKSKWKF
ncbi:hypothetical protein [uncultured Aquimarina sp.]|uniref:hypothetical protein n=1 Tax=uncultured Aquimarina sp. TaxID=575652 RepID=UPI002623EDC3|nr:hypothetical protein [uncultured Aquimarina sp.]